MIFLRKNSKNVLIFHFCVTIVLSCVNEKLKVFTLAGLWLPGPELKAAAGIAGKLTLG